MKYMGQTMSGPGENKVVYKAYKEFGGIKMPATILRSSGGIDIEMEITSADINGSYDTTLFEKPEGI